MFVSNPSKSKLLNYNLCLNVTLEHIISRPCQMVEPSRGKCHFELDI